MVENAACARPDPLADLWPIVLHRPAERGVSKVLWQGSGPCPSSPDGRSCLPENDPATALLRRKRARRDDGVDLGVIKNYQEP